MYKVQPASFQLSDSSASTSPVDRRPSGGGGGGCSLG
jgi:hypothetical protein